MFSKAINGKIRFLLFSIFALLLLSWGSLGHRTVGLIAQKHLSPKAQKGVQSLLGSTTLADVSTWADEVRNQTEFKCTGPWHYLNLPIGLSKDEFIQTIKTLNVANVYQALINQEHLLLTTSNSEEKTNALKYIVHFIGDLHQPMHVSRAEDQGGNKIQVNYEGKGTNLHSLWDSRLLEHEGLSDQQLASKVDKATPQQIKDWQNTPLEDWLWESYQLSSQLYKEVEGMKNRTITDQYYQTHIGIAEERLEKAGIRLAGVLNQLFDQVNVSEPTTAPPASTSKLKSCPPFCDPENVTLSNINSYVGQTIQVCGQIYGRKEFSSMTLVNLGAAYPHQLLNLVLKGEAKEAFPYKDGQTVCATGLVELYKGKPQIIVTDKTLLH